METPRRLAPRDEVTRRLYLASGNRCAYPQCEQPLMSAQAVLVGEIAHIEGALPGAARFNSAMCNETRRSYDNLLLLCATHHRTIDRDVRRWTVAALKELKCSHEAIYTAAIERLRRQVGDITDGVTYIPAENGLALLERHNLTDDERSESCNELNGFAERLSKVPAGARSLLAVIVARGETANTSYWGGAEVQIGISVLRSLADCTSTQLRQHVEVLEHFNLLVVDLEPFDGPQQYLVGGSTPGVGWTLLEEIRDLAAGDQTLIRRVLCNLDFSALDRS